MRGLALIVCVSTFVGVANAAWYWPFGDGDSVFGKTRLSVLMEPASLAIDRAEDLAADGKATEAVEEYKNALAELDRVERENPERAATHEFASLRNKRAYVNAAIDSLLLASAKANAKAVAVSDTTELEKKMADEDGKAKPAAKAPKPDGATKPSAAKPPRKAVAKTRKAKTTKPSKPLTKSQQAAKDIAEGEYEAAMLVIRELLDERPNNASALNLKAVCEARQGRFAEAEKTLDQAIQSNPRDHYAYYNMANLKLQTGGGNKAVAQRYYETGRTVGGPRDAELEEKLR